MVINNRVLLHGDTFPYLGTFFVFSDYAQPAICLAALSKLPVIYVFTHDSIAVGFDGATHESIEHLANYRAMPNVAPFRSADANETIATWEIRIVLGRLSYNSSIIASIATRT